MMLHFGTCPETCSDKATSDSHICDCWQNKAQEFSSSRKEVHNDSQLKLEIFIVYMEDRKWKQ